MFVKVVDGIVQKEISTIPRSGFYPIENYNPDELKFENFSTAVFNGEKVIVSPLERDIESAKVWLKDLLYAVAKEKQDRAFSKYSTAECVTFPEKKRQAQLLDRTGNPDDAPMLVAIAAMIAAKSNNNLASALEELKNSILAKAGFEDLTFQIESVRKIKALIIDSASSVEDLADFYYSDSWQQDWPI